MSERICLCGVTCFPGGENCNGYCTGKTNEPLTYTAPDWAFFSAAEDALLRAIQAGSASAAPEKIALHGKWHEVLIGIGADHTAKILIDADTLSTLKERAARRNMIPHGAQFPNRQPKIEAAQ